MMHCSSPLSATRWHVIMTMPNAEAKSVYGLTARGYVAYGPTIVRTLSGSDVPRPMFPGYVFAQINDLEFYRLKSIPGIRDVLRVDSVPATLDGSVIDMIADMEAEIEDRRLAAIAARNGHDFTAGQTVKVISGIMKDYVSKIDSLCGAGRVRILFDLFGRMTPTIVNVSEIAALEPMEIGAVP